MDTARDALPDDITALKEALATERAKALDIAAELAVARAKASEDSALIAQQKLRIAKLERQIYGQRSERSSRLVDQLALTFEELEASATEDELAAEKAVARTTTVRGFTRTRPERNTFPDHLPRERVVIDPPAACECCGGNRLRKLGEDVTGRWNRCRASGKWSRRCARSSLAATARRSARRRHRSMPLQEAGLAQACWP
jgi:transposase